MYLAYVPHAITLFRRRCDHVILSPFPSYLTNDDEAGCFESKYVLHLHILCCALLGVAAGIYANRCSLFVYLLASLMSEWHLSLLKNVSTPLGYVFTYITRIFLESESIPRMSRYFQVFTPSQTDTGCVYF